MKVRNFLERNDDFRPFGKGVRREYDPDPPVFPAMIKIEPIFVKPP